VPGTRWKQKKRIGSAVKKSGEGASRQPHRREWPSEASPGLAVPRGGKEVWVSKAKQEEKEINSELKKSVEDYLKPKNEKGTAKSHMNENSLRLAKRKDYTNVWVSKNKGVEGKIYSIRVRKTLRVGSWVHNRRGSEMGVFLRPLKRGSSVPERIKSRKGFQIVDAVEGAATQSHLDGLNST